MSCEVEAWARKPLGELVVNHDRRRIPLSKSERATRQGPYPYWGANGILDWVDDFLFEGPHVLVAEDGTVERDDGRAVVHLPEGRFWVSNHAHVLTAAANVDLTWLYYALSSLKIHPYLTGSVQLKLTQKNLNRIELITPPSAEQRRIAWVLGSLDDKIELNRRIAETLEQIVAAIFKARFVDFVGVEEFEESELGPIPKGWSIGSVADLCARVANGGTPKRMEPKFWTGGTVPWFKTGELKDGLLPSTSEQQITDVALAESSCKLFPAGTVLIAIYAAPTVGRLGVLSEPGSFNQACTGLQPKDGVGTWFLFHTLRELRGHYNGVASGSAQQNISKRIVESARCVVPPSSELAAFAAVADPLFARASVLRKESETLSSIRDALLPRLISGKIRVPEGFGPDEAAEVAGELVESEGQKQAAETGASAA